MRMADGGWRMADYISHWRSMTKSVGSSLQVSRDIQAATSCQIIPTQREHRILIAKGLIAKARIKKSQIIKGPIIKVQIKYAEMTWHDAIPTTRVTKEEREFCEYW